MINTSPIITATELKEIIHQENLIILDASAGKDAYKNIYLKKHIKNALFIDLENDMASNTTDASIGGRHPLPSIFDFAKTLSDLGITESSAIVIYDDKNGSNAASRCWWMLMAFGLNNVRVLSGGIQSAEKAGIEMFENQTESENKQRHIHKSSIKIPNHWLLPTTTIQEVEEEIANDTAVVIDVRDAYRYRGESEPIDLVAGHIPGAINLPFSENLDEDGEFLSREKLREKYQNIMNKKLIIHCGSGVTACHTILSLVSAGFDVPNLYVGSWSEWSRTHRKIAKDSI